MTEKKPITEDARLAWEALNRASLALDIAERPSTEPCLKLVQQAIDSAFGEIVEEFGYSDYEEFKEALAISESEAVQASLKESNLQPEPCPAGNPNCGARLYSASQFVNCPVCGLPNPNYSKVTEVRERVSNESGKIAGQTPIADIKSGVIKWT